MSFDYSAIAAKADAAVLRFGKPATYRTYDSESYDNTTGKTTKGSATDTATYAVEAPAKPQEFTEEVTAQMATAFLIAGGDLLAAGVTPAVNETLVVGGLEYRILAIKVVRPGATSVLYKMAVQNA